MTPKEFFTNLQDYLQTVTWTGTSTLVFGNNVYVCCEIPIGQLSRYVSPCVFIVDQGFSLHEEHPKMGIQNFNLDFFIENTSSSFGEGAILDANRTTGTSRGVGILTLEDEILDKLCETNVLNSVKIRIIEKSCPKQTIISGNRPSIMRSISCAVLLSTY
jgi:hypothetical protein